MTYRRVHEWQLPMLNVTFEVSAYSDRGHIRAVNEDSYVAAPPIFAVADGMGGHAFGDLASQTAAGVLSSRLAVERPLDPAEVVSAIAAANTAVAAIDSGEQVAGTTLAGIALVRPDGSEDLHWMVFNIGDSRVYRWDGRSLSQVSVDHSAVQELIDNRTLDARDAATHADRNIVTRALGIEVGVDSDVWIFPVDATESFFVCSDGLTKEVDDLTLSEILSSLDLKEARAEHLVRAALAAGGRDNVTVVSVAITIDRGVDVATGIDAIVPEHLEETLPRT